MFERIAKSDTAGYAKSLQVATGNGSLKTLRVHNNGAATVYLQFHDAAALPADTTAPAAPPVPVAAGQYYETDTPFDFSVGLNVCASSTADTKTLIGANDVWITAEYRY